MKTENVCKTKPNKTIELKSPFMPSGQETDQAYFAVLGASGIGLYKHVKKCQSDVP